MANAFGTVLQYSGATPTVVGGLSNIGAPEITRDTIEETNHESPDGYKEFIGGLKDGGEFTVEGTFAKGDTGQAAIMAHINQDTDGGKKTIEIIFPDTSKWSASTICTKCKPGDSPVGGSIGFSATFKVTGKPTFTEAAA
jgi:hypothetical protein